METIKKIRNFLRRLFARRYVDLSRYNEFLAAGITPVFSFSDLRSGGENGRADNC